MKKFFFCSKTEFLNFNLTLPLDKLVMVRTRLVSNVLNFSSDNPVVIQLVTFLLLFNVSELSIGEKTKKFWRLSLPVKYILPNKKLCPFVVNSLNFSNFSYLSDCNWTRTNNHLVRKRTLNHLAKLTLKRLSCVVSAYLYGAFDCMFLSCHVRVSEWIQTKWLSVRLRTKWLWVRVQLQSLKLQISRLFWARSSLTSRQL